MCTLARYIIDYWLIDQEISLLRSAPSYLHTFIKRSFIHLTWVACYIIPTSVLMTTYRRPMQSWSVSSMRRRFCFFSNAAPIISGAPTHLVKKFLLQFPPRQNPFHYHRLQVHQRRGQYHRPKCELVTRVVLVTQSLRNRPARKHLGLQ